jgi:alpha-glucoside transport system substrate-binding protein
MNSNGLRRHGWRAMIAPAIAAGLALAGCGSSGGGSPVGSGTPSASQVTGTIRVNMNWTGPELDAFKAVVKGFESKYPDATVKPVQIPFETANEQIPQQFASGSPPDVTVALPGMMRLLAEHDFLVPLDDLWQTWVADKEYTPSLRDIATYNGHQYAVLFKGNVNSLIWYQPATFKKYGLTVPHDWAGFMNLLATAKQKSGTDPVTVGGKDQWPLTQWSDSMLAAVGGADVYNGLLDNSIKWDDPRVVKAYQMLADIMKNYFPSDALDIGFNDATCKLMDGKAIVQNQGAFVNLTAQSCNPNLKSGTDYTFFPLPADNSGGRVQFMSGDMFAVSKASKNVETAKAFVAYLGSPGAQEIWAKLGGFVAPNAKVPLSVYPTSNDRKAAELWPARSGAAALYDLDDDLGGKIQTTEDAALQTLVQDHDVDKFIQTMVGVSKEVRG